MTPKQKKYLVISGGLIAFYTILGFLIIPMILTSMVPDKMAQALNRPVSIEKIRLNPYTLSVTLKNLAIKDTDGSGEFVSLTELYANLQIMSLFKQGLVLKEVKLESPKITLIRESGVTFNFSDLAAGNSEVKEEPQEPQEPSDPFRFAVSRIRIINGTFIYRDEPFGKTHTMASINWTVPYISNFTKDHDTYSEPDLSCNIDGATLTLGVKTKPFKNTMETQVNLNLSGISLPRYAAYIPKDQVALQIDQGTLGIAVQVAYHQEGESASVMAQGRVSLKNLDVADEKGRNMVHLPNLTVSMLPSDVMTNQIHIGTIQIDSPAISCIRETDGALNVATVVKTPDTPPDEQTPKEPETVKTPSDGNKESSPFYVDLKTFRLSGGSVQFTDYAAGTESQPVETSVKDLQLSVSGFSNRPNTPATFDLATILNDSAKISLGGTFTPDPVSVQCDLDIADVSLTWSQPYLPENLALVITGGLASVSGHTDLALPADGPMSLSITGKTGVKGFATVDPDKAESFVKWSDFTVDGINVTLEPLAIAIDTIAFKDLANQVVIFKDGSTNLQKIFITAEEEKPDSETKTVPAKAEEAAPVIPIRIGKVTLANTELGFIDRSISPHYATRLALKNLDVTGLTSEDFKAATIKADGVVDGNAPVKINGTLNPLAKDMFIDIDISLANAEMVAFSPYTGKYIGKAIEKGKLNVNVDYLIKDKAIKADNHLFLDQFTLGKNVDSPDAMNLPVGLAISLLKDRKGVIDIAMPIAGRTDDPDFKWGGAVLKTLVNLIMKAATSPFALVGSLVGGGEELRYIEFEPGKAILNQTDHEKLAAIQKLLVERPGLKLDILGYADTGADRSALAALALERKIKAPEIMAALKKGAADTPETVAAIVQTPEDRTGALRTLYKKDVLAAPLEGQTPKPLNDPTLTPGDMETALAQTIIVTNADLGLLAIARANEVKTALLSDGSVEPERIFLKEPESLTPPVAEGFKPSRVELGLK